MAAPEDFTVIKVPLNVKLFNVIILLLKNFSLYFVLHQKFYTKLYLVFRYIFEINSSFCLKNHRTRTSFQPPRNVSWTEHINLNLSEKKACSMIRNNPLRPSARAWYVCQYAKNYRHVALENEKLSYDNSNADFYDCTYMLLIMKKYIFKSTNIVFHFLQHALLTTWLDYWQNCVIDYIFQPFSVLIL